MSLFDFFFPQQAQAGHLRRLAERQERQARVARIRSQKLEAQEQTQEALAARVDQLEHDLGFVCLVLAGLLEELEDQGGVTRDRIQSAIQVLDSKDGLTDGRLDVNLLRGKLS